MKKIFYVFALSFFAVTAANAQASFGVKAGVNLAKISGNDFADETDRKLGVVFGGYGRVGLTDLLYFQPELLFSSQGYKTEFTYTDFDPTTFETFEVTEELKLKTTYLNVPLMVGANFDGFNVQVGPQLGLLLSAKSESDVNGNSEEEDVKDELKSIDLGLNIGVGYELESGLNFGARYGIGLSDIAEDNEGDAVKNSVLQFTIGYTLNR